MIVPSASFGKVTIEAMPFPSFPSFPFGIVISGDSVPSLYVNLMMTLPSSVSLLTMTPVTLIPSLPFVIGTLKTVFS